MEEVIIIPVDYISHIGMHIGICPSCENKLSFEVTGHKCDKCNQKIGWIV